MLGTALALAMNSEEDKCQTSSSRRSIYLYVSFVVIPITTYLLVLTSSVYLTDMKLIHFTRTDFGERKKQHRQALQNKVILSLVAVFYILSLSAASIYNTIIMSDINKPALSYLCSEEDELAVASSLPTVTLILDAIIAFLTLICLAIMACTRNIWKFANYSIFFPLCCIVNHSCYILVACVHNIWHAIHMAGLYTLAGITMSAVLTQVSYLVDKRMHKNCRHRMSLHLAVKLVTLFLLCGYVGLIALFYAFLPVKQNSLLLPGPLNLISVFTICAVLSVCLYWWASKTPHSFLWILAEAETQQRRNNGNDPWHRKTAREQEMAIARALLLKLFPTLSKESSTDNVVPQESHAQGEDTDGGVQNTTSFSLQEITSDNSDTKS